MKSIDKVELHEIFKELEDNKNNKFNELYSKYSNLVYRIAFSILKNEENSKDIMQKVFLKIWEMDKDKLPTNNEASWLYSITKNETLNYLRANKNAFDLDELYYVSSEDNELNKMLDRDKYNRIIAGLNVDEQEIVSLKILSNLSFKEISQILKMPIGTVQWKYYKSIHTLKILISNLSMFIIAITSFVIGNTINREKSADKVEEITQKDENKENEKVEQDGDDYDEYRENENKEVSKGDLPNKENNEIDNTTNGTTENTVIEVNIPRQKFDYKDIRILSIAGITLTISIIFSIIFIKHQQKAKKKVSK